MAMKLTYDIDDVHSLALCTWKEARGEGNDGLRAVMHVIRNRAIRWYAKYDHPIHYAVYAKNQFTSMSVPSDNQYNLEPKDDDAEYTHCIVLSPVVLDGVDTDVTNGALYYARLEFVTSGWFKTNIMERPDLHPIKATIGHQVFYG